MKEADLGNSRKVKPTVIVVDDDPIVNNLALILLRKVAPEWEMLSFKDGQAFCDRFALGGGPDKSSGGRTLLSVS